jgi:23S rRNA (guanosine2251-2'-O)-methyltransferase
VVDLARSAKIPVRFEDRGSLQRIAGSAVHQGIIAMGAASQYADFDETAVDARLVVVLDGIEDPHNLGAIVRTANAAGAGAVVIPERRAAGLTETVAKAAAGALEYTPISRVVNINRALEDLKKRGFWIYGIDERGTEDYDKVDWATPTAIVMGAEGKGLHQQVKQHCDTLVRIPMAGKIASLNVSVATGVVLFAWKSRISAKM